MEASVYIATSLDGFIARQNGALDWLHEFGQSSPDEDYGYRSFMDSIDPLVMGRVTYETVRSFPTWPYRAKPVVVLSTRHVEIPSDLSGSVEHMSGPPVEILARLEPRGLQHLYVDGGKTIQGFFAAGRVQRLIVNRLPILIGTGIPLLVRRFCGEFEREGVWQDWQVHQAEQRRQVSASPQNQAARPQGTRESGAEPAGCPPPAQGEVAQFSGSRSRTSTSGAGHGRSTSAHNCAPPNHRPLRAAPLNRWHVR